MKIELIQDFTKQYELLLHLFERAKSADDGKQIRVICNKLISTLDNLNLLCSQYGEKFSKFSRYVYTISGRPYKACNILEQAINTNSPEIVSAIFTKYLKTQLDRVRFFNEFTDAREEKFNFHYFEKDLSPETRYKAHCFDNPDNAYKILQQGDTRSDEQKRREEIYYIIRDRLLQDTDDDSLNGSSSISFAPSKPKRHFDNNFQKMYVNVYGTGGANSFVWKKEEPKLAKMTLRCLADDFWPERIAVIKNLDINKEQSFAQQAFRQVDFPELFSDMGKMLNQVGRSIKLMQKDGEFHTLAAAIEQKGTKLYLENKEDKDFKGNGKDGVGYAGYFSPADNKIVINGSCLSVNKPERLAVLLKHEAAHAVDHVAFTDSGLYVWGVLAAIKNPSLNPQRAAIVDEIKEYHHAESFYCEAMARINSMPIHPEDKLLQNMKKFMLWEARALAKDEKAIINRGKFCGLKIKHRLNIVQAGTDYAEAREALSKIKLSELTSSKSAQTLKNFVAKKAAYDMRLFSAYGTNSTSKMEDEINLAFDAVFEDFDTLSKNKDCAKYDLPEELYDYEKTFTNGEYPIEIAVMLDWLDVCRNGKWNGNYAGLSELVHKRYSEASEEKNPQLKYAKLQFAMQPVKMALLDGMHNFSDSMQFEITKDNLSDEKRVEAMERLFNNYLSNIDKQAYSANYLQSQSSAILSQKRGR